MQCIFRVTRGEKVPLLLHLLYVRVGLLKFPDKFIAKEVRPMIGAVVAIGDTPGIVAP